jgi:hypothetical protein
VKKFEADDLPLFAETADADADLRDKETEWQKAVAKTAAKAAARTAADDEAWFAGLHAQGFTAAQILAERVALIAMRAVNAPDQKYLVIPDDPDPIDWKTFVKECRRCRLPYARRKSGAPIGDPHSCLCQQ